MSYTIGFAGKGGTGKSTIAGMVLRYITDMDMGPALAIDADPNSSLGELLGLEADETVVGIIDDIAANIEKIPPGMTKERLLESRIQQSLGEGNGLDLLVMGRPEGPGCYCYPNSMLRESISRLERSYKYIIIDNEAGMEHLSRRTDRKIDYLFLISDPTVHSLRSAKRIYDLAKDLKVSCGITHLIINRVKGSYPNLEGEIKKIGADIVDYIKESDELIDSGGMGKPLKELNANAEFVKSVYKICGDAKWH